MEDNSLESYRKAVEFLAKNKVDDLIFNSGDEHAAIIFSNIFSNSDYQVKIFAGNLQNAVTEKPEYISSIAGLLYRGARLEILLDNFDDSVKKDSDLFKKLHYYEKRVSIKCTNTRFYATRVTDDGHVKDHVHFCTGDSGMYRLETDTEKRSARCNFNDSPFVEFLNGLFDETFKTAQTVEWDSLISINESD
ncbi:MAG: hypothetical protein LBT50_04410 [Prevotellaceae bacterium]|jgi:hypothetical protein|nr:hypothetical protein [Prevotellaceae bacterium]